MQLMSDAFQISGSYGFKRTMQFDHLLLVCSGILSGPFLLIPSFPKHSLHSSSHSQETEVQGPADKGAVSPAAQSVGSLTSPVPGVCFVSLICVSADGPVRYCTPGW